jgi:hypothetical protein
VQQVQVEVVGAEPAQAHLAGQHGAPATRVVREHLADEEHVVAAVGDGLAYQHLGRAVGVHLGGVDDGHAQAYTEAQRRDLRGPALGPFGEMAGALSQS